MKVEKIIAILIVITGISSCEKDFLVSQQSGAKKMVVNSLFNDNGPFTVYLTDSYEAAGYGNINSINDAQIQLYENNVLKEVMKYTPSDTVNTFGAYKSILVPQKGKIYSIKINEPVYGLVTATDTIPLATTIVSSQLVQYGDSATHSNDVIVDMKIQDDATVANYYRINIWIGGLQWHLDGNGDTITQQYFEARGPQMLTPVVDTVRDGIFLLFSDRNFNGQTKELKMKFDKMDPTNFVYLNLYIDLFTASKTDYTYQQTLALYRSAAGSNSAEPVHVYNNIQNGYGVFAAEQFQEVPFNIK